MKCKAIQELILTDYSDGQLSLNRRRQLEGHLQGCPACQGLAQKVQNQGIAPFKNLNPARPDEFVWLHIKEKIEQEQSVRNSAVGAWDIIAGFVFSMRPLALAASVAVVLFAMAPVLYTNLAAKPSYLNYVMETDNSPSSEVASGVEQYFL